MIVIGLLLLIAAVIFGADFVFANHHHLTDPVVFGQSLGLHSDASIFIVGAITGAAVLAGLALIASGMRRKAAKAITHHQERKESKGTRSERDQLAEKNEELQRQLSLQGGAERASRKGRPTLLHHSPVEERGATRIEGEDATEP